MNTNEKEIITDLEAIGGYCEAIDPRKEGKLLQEITLSLKNTMRAKNLKSLSAPQIGYNYRVFCIKFGENDYRTFVNPMLENTSKFQFVREKCSSIPDKEFIRPRFGTINVMYMTPMGKITSTKLVGLAAFTFEHCLDHLDGLTLADVGLEIDEMFDNATAEEQAEVLKMYADSLDIRQKELEQEIENDKELSSIDKATKFIRSVQSGETILEDLKTEKTSD